MCRDKPVSPMMKIQDVLDLWFKITPTMKAPVVVGGSANEFLMQLTYSRKV